MTTDDESISNECIYDLIINFTKSLRIIKKRSNCSSIRDYISKLLSNSDITKEVILNNLTDNNKIKNKPTNGRNSYYIIDEIPLQVEIPPNPSGEFITGPVSYENTCNQRHRKIFISKSY